MMSMDGAHIQVDNTDIYTRTGMTPFGVYVIRHVACQPEVEIVSAVKGVTITTRPM